MVALLVDGDVVCTGTLITSTVVLTAAHCLQGELVSDVDVGFGSDGYEPVATRAAIRLAIHSDYGDWSLTGDIGLIEMASAAPESITPIPYLPASLGFTSEDIGDPLRFVGYGETEDDGFGIRLQWTGELGALCEDDCEFGSEDMVAKTIAYDQSEGGPCSGDSGGPAFFTRGETVYVAGVTSYGEDCWGTGVSTWVDQYESFIQAFLNNEDMTGCEEASCETGMPCDSDNDCGNGACFIESDSPDFVDGYCTAECFSDADCSGDGVCYSFGWSSWCLDACESNDDCRDGYYCEDDTCSPLPAGSGDAETGEACERTSDCAVEGSDCYSESGDGFPDGMCTVSCEDDDDCDSGTICSDDLCLPSCARNSDCRDGYVCWPEEGRPGVGACWKSCLEDDYCRGDNECNEYGLCGDLEPPSADGPSDPDPDPDTDPGTDPDGTPNTPKTKKKPGGCSATSPADWAWLLMFAGLRRVRRTRK